LSRRGAFGVYHAARTALAGRRSSVDSGLGYSVFRAIQPAKALAELPRAAVAVVQNAGMLALAREFSRVGVPSVAYLHGLEFETWRGENPDKPRCFPFRGYIANSRFTANRFRQVHGLDAVVLPPFFRREQYATQVTGRMVTFVNPVAEKGVDLALDIAARCSNIQFCFVRGWPLSSKDEAKLKARIERLGNVQLRNRTSDMRAVYRDTRILLVPSQWEAETWGRVVSEAQISGIPVIASNRGGLPEAVGPGGVIIGYDDSVDVWSKTVCKVWSDDEYYSKLSQNSLIYSERPEINSASQITMLLSALERFIR
jgi:glycosyltransferase involved in cell wall biosynthesis